mmetsp:Transcript_16417/g.20993  ORF Transcript_16417/g.20993 Transcript_16417/m.20993 type:complete len:109 (-) Transcript_16417:728-1054(-)
MFIIEEKCTPTEEEPKETKRRRNESQPLSDDDRHFCSLQDLQKLDQCEQVRESVSDKRLQALIEQILNDPNPLQAVKDILQSNPDFAEFGDLCLRTIGIRDDSGNCLL